jgi:hypothetical protein
VAQDQPGVDEIVASQWDRIGGDVVTGHLEMAQLGGRDEPGIDVGGEDASRRPDPMDSAGPAWENFTFGRASGGSRYGDLCGNRVPGRKAG